MQDTIEQLLNYLYGIWRYRWLVIIIAWVVAPVGWFVVSKMPNKYEATTQVYVDTNTLLKPLLKGISIETLDSSEQFSLMAKELLSRPNLERIIRDVDLDIQVTTDAQKEALIHQLERTLHVDLMSTKKSSRRNEAPSLYKLSAQHSDPKMAYRIVQSLLDSFVEGSLSDNRAGSLAARQFLDNEIKQYEVKLIAAENRLRKFRSKNINVLPEQGSGYYQRLRSVQADLESVNLELKEEEHRRDELLRQLENTSKTQQVVSEDRGIALSPIDQRIVAMQTRLDDLLLTYTDEHPDVSEVRNILGELERTKQNELSLENEDGSSRINNPVYQQVQLALGEVEANMAAIKVRQREYKKRARDLQRQVKTLPLIEAQLQALNRDYDVNRSNYDALVARREAAKVGAAAEQTGEHVKIKVIEPPRMPVNPTAPNRLMLTSVVLLAALGAGTGLAFLLSQIRLVYYNQSSVREELGLPVLGTVSFAAQPKDLRRDRIILTGYVMIVSTLIIAYLGVMYFHFIANAQ